MKTATLDAGPGVKAFSCAPDNHETIDLDIIADVIDRVLITPVQTHTSNIAIAAPGGSYPDTDALVATDPAVAVGVRTADCVPIVLNATDIGAIAAVHAGWRGTLAGILDKTVARLLEMGADPAAMHAAMGPCICGSCYEVSEELALRFGATGRHLNLAEENRRQLLARGIPPAHIKMPPLCTLHSPSLWPSWRRDGAEAPRLFTIISRLQKPPRAISEYV